MNIRENNFRFSAKKPASNFWLKTLIVNLILLGIIFRISNIEHKVYWHDEVYTVLRSGGYFSEDLTRSLFNNQVLTAQELRQYLDIKPQSTIVDTLQSLAREDPQHPPLYFLINRWWMQIWGTSLTALRSLPVLISLLSLPAIYYLTRELFPQSLASLLSILLLSLSPLDILFAPVSRQNSLWTFLVIISSYCLLKALRSQENKYKMQWWGLYCLSCLAGFYTHLYFILTYIAQVLIFLIAIVSYPHFRYHIKAWIISNSLILLGIFPWVMVMVHNYSRALSVTSWSQGRYSLDTVKLWFLNATALLVDLDLGFNHPLTYVARLPFLLVLLVSCYWLGRQQSRFICLFLFSLAGLPWLLLICSDLASGSQRSTVGRYLIACYPFLQIIMAYGLAYFLATGQKWRYGLIALLLSCTVISNTINSFSLTSWSKTPSNGNIEASQLIRQAKTPLIVTDRGNYFTNLGNILALSYTLPINTPIGLLTYPTQTPMLADVLAQHQGTVFVYDPSDRLLASLAALGHQALLVQPEGRLFKLKVSD
ncbi:glycosyltransferase family 39 protein [Synechocystis sp. LKSZ1]|uniref:glycosyltransferase family 39 protein n=1 Tax=Synechocystis sp. LKSZ1 TaxID=3144951 RepID=UPI00336C2B26